MRVSNSKNLIVSLSSKYDLIFDGVKGWAYLLIKKPFLA